MSNSERGARGVGLRFSPRAARYILFFGIYVPPVLLIRQSVPGGTYIPFSAWISSDTACHVPSRLWAFTSLCIAVFTVAISEVTFLVLARPGKSHGREILRCSRFWNCVPGTIRALRGWVEYTLMFLAVEPCSPTLDYNGQQVGFIFHVSQVERVNPIFVGDCLHPVRGADVYGSGRHLSLPCTISSAARRWLSGAL